MVLPAQYPSPLFVAKSQGSRLNFIGCAHSHTVVGACLSFVWFGFLTQLFRRCLHKDHYERMILANGTVSVLRFQNRNPKKPKTTANFKFGTGFF